MSAKFEPLKRVGAFYLDQYQKSVGDEDTVWVMLVRGLEFMHYNTTAEPKTVRLPVQGQKTVVLPADYVQWSKIGLLNQNGKVSTLKINTALTTYADTRSNRVSLLTPDLNTAWIGNSDVPYLNYYTNGVYAPLFGVGGGLITYGECRVDEPNNLIVLSPDFHYDEIIFEYISAPERDLDYMVDIRLREPLIAWCAWKFKMDTELNFYNRYTESNRMMKPLRMQVFQDIIREGNKFCLKG